MFIVHGRRSNLILGSSYLKSFKSSLQSHPLWVTLYVFTYLHFTHISVKKTTIFFNILFINTIFHLYIQIYIYMSEELHYIEDEIESESLSAL